MGARVYGVGARVYGAGARVYGSLVIIESAPVQRIGFLVFQTWSGLWGPDLGTIGTGDWDLDLGLTIKKIKDLLIKIYLPDNQKSLNLRV